MKNIIVERQESLLLGQMIFIYFPFMILEGIIMYFVYSSSPPNYLLVETNEVAAVKSVIFLGITLTIGVFITVILLFKCKRRIPEVKYVYMQTYRGLLSHKKVLAFLAFHTFFALPWILAFHGIFVSDVPILNMIFLGREEYHGYPAVHLGNHHGYSGFLALLITTAVIMEYRQFCGRTQQIMLFSGIVGFQYGILAYWEDLVHEQLYKRGIPIKLWYPAFEKPGINEVIFLIVAAIIATYITYVVTSSHS